MSKPGAYITNNTTQFTRLYSLGCVMLNTLKLLSSAPTDTDSSDITWDSLSDFIQLPLETQKALYYFFTHVVVLNTWKQMLMCEIGGVPLQDTVCGDQEVTTSPWFQHHVFSQEYENEFLRAIFWCDLPLSKSFEIHKANFKALCSMSCTVVIATCRTTAGKSSMNLLYWNCVSGFPHYSQFSWWVSGCIAILKTQM